MKPNAQKCLKAPDSDSSQLVVIDPVVAEMSKLVDEFCVLACDAAGAFRSMQAGKHKETAAALSSIMERALAATGSTHSIIGKYAKKSRGLAREKPEKLLRLVA